MFDLTEITDYIRGLESFTLPAIQMQFGLTYAEAKNAVDGLLSARSAEECGDGVYAFRDSASPARAGDVAVKIFGLGNDGACIVNRLSAVDYCGVEYYFPDSIGEASCYGLGRECVIFAVLRVGDFYGDLPEELGKLGKKCGRPVIFMAVLPARRSFLRFVRDGDAELKALKEYCNCLFLFDESDAPREEGDFLASAREFTERCLSSTLLALAKSLACKQSTGLTYGEFCELFMNGGVARAGIGVADGLEDFSAAAKSALSFPPYYTGKKEHGAVLVLVNCGLDTSPDVFQLIEDVFFGAYGERGEYYGVINEQWLKDKLQLTVISVDDE